MSTIQSSRKKSIGTIAPTDVPLKKLPTVKLTPEEIKRVDEIARARSESYQSIDGGVVFGDRNSLTSHQVGFLGETAVGKFYRLPIDSNIYPENGDNGVDLQLYGTGIDVKTTATTALELPQLLVRADKGLSADMYVRTHVLSCDRSGAKVRILGAASKQVVKDRKPRKHPGSTRNYVVEPSELTLLPALQS
jgi:hypothetical protein